jgi:hypothetical protein
MVTQKGQFSMHLGLYEKAVISPDTVEKLKGKYARAVLGPSKLPENNHIVDKFYVHMLAIIMVFGKGIPIPPRHLCLEPRTT